MTQPEARSRSELRRRRRVRTWASIGVVALVAVAAGVGVIALSGGSQEKEPVAAPTRPRVVGPIAANVSADLGRVPFRAGATKGYDIPVFGAPDPAAEPVHSLSTKTEYLLPRTVLAFDQFQDWLHVYVPARPNSSTGWVKMSDVELSPPLEWEIRVSVADRQLWLLRNGTVEFETGVAVGTQQYPTPTGTFYITDPLDLHSRPNLGYGVFALGLSGYSEVLTEFMGGDGQIAIHGTNNPGDIGRDISHGCVRVTNEAIERLSTLPLGTPVVIT